MTPTARATIAGYCVYCPSCDAVIPAPSSLIGRTLWLPDELRTYPRVYCTECGLTFAVERPQEGK